MKKVVSVSLGSSKRDHKVQVELLGEQFEISRVGVDGDMEKALKVLGELDGHVDAIGLGGIDVYVYVAKKRYEFVDGLKLMNAVKRTPVVDGSGLKNTLERETINYLINNTSLLRPGMKVLMVSAADRFGMAEVMEEAGYDMTFGDLIFAAGIPYPIKSVAELEEFAKKLLPEMVKLPFEMLYPVGDKQTDLDIKKAERFEPYYQEAEVIAGDFHYIRKYLPEKLNGQVIITNTVTRDDVELFRQRGASYLVTTTPEFNGRSFGTNVIEGVMVAILNKKCEEITPEDYHYIIEKLQFKPRIVKLN